MSRWLSLLLVLICLVPMGYCADTHTPEPYEKDEFPQWAKDLRRAEIISMGAVPFAIMSYPFAKSCFDAAAHGGNLSYIKSPLARSDDAKELGIACCIGLGVGLTDFIVQSIKRHNRIKAAKKAQKRAIWAEEVTQEQLEAERREKEKLEAERIRQIEEEKAKATPDTSEANVSTEGATEGTVEGATEGVTSSDTLEPVGTNTDGSGTGTKEDKPLAGAGDGNE